MEDKMPRKAKDDELNITKKAETIKKATASRKLGSDKVKTSVAKKTSNTVKKATSTKKMADTVKKTSSTKKTATTAKKNASTTRKKATSKVSKKSNKKVNISIEYYDLPVAYDKTIVKILAQTPSCLFVYWEISNKDKLQLQKEYGEKFFQDTKPYLVIINETMNYSFETEINDYANSWYINLHDSDCKYSVKLTRKPINQEIPTYASSIDIVSSNEIDAPNDHILFDKLGKTVFFKNVQTNIISKQDISSLSFISNIGKIYNIYDFYKIVYHNELTGDELGTNLSSSQFSSFFK